MACIRRLTAALGLFLAGACGAHADSVLLSSLINNSGSLSVGGVTFSDFDSALGPTEQNRIAVDVAQSGPNDVAIRVRAPAVTNNPYGLNSQNCVASGPGICPGGFIDSLRFRVTSTTGVISATYLFTLFSQNISGNSFYNDGTVAVAGQNGLNFANNCDTTFPLTCNNLVVTGYQNVGLGTQTDVTDNINLQFNGVPLGAGLGYRIAVLSFEQHFLLNGTTVVAAASSNPGRPGSPGAVISSDGNLVLFPVPEPSALALLGTGLLGLLALRQVNRHRMV